MVNGAPKRRTTAAFMAGPPGHLGGHPIVPATQGGAIPSQPQRAVAFPPWGRGHGPDGSRTARTYGRHMTEQLTALDATFLELEQADPTAHMHIGGVLVFDPVPRRGAPTLDQLQRRLEQRLPLLPRFTQRLSAPAVTGLRRPHWEHDDGFRLDAHVRRAALPAPGGEAELLDWAAEFYSSR